MPCTKSHSGHFTTTWMRAGWNSNLNYEGKSFVKWAQDSCNEEHWHTPIETWQWVDWVIVALSNGLYKAKALPSCYLIWPLNGLYRCQFVNSNRMDYQSNGIYSCYYFIPNSCIRNNIPLELWYVITYPCPNFNGGFAKWPIALGYEWVIKCHRKL